MATIAELLVKISADSAGLRKELQASQRQLQRSFGKNALDMGQGIATGMGFAAAAMGAVGVAAVKMAANMEQNRIAFTTMMGSAQAAESFLSSLAAFAEKTPFEFTGLVESSKRLLAYGYTAQEVIPMLTGIGDAVAAMGGSADVLDRVTLAFGQMKAKGFVSGEEMRQLAEAGIPAWQFLANVIGKDIPTTMKLAEDKALNAEAAIAGMIEQMGVKYGGMMEKQSGTITGILSNMKDKAGNIMRTLGDQIVEGLDLKKKMQSALTFIDGLSDRIKAAGVGQALLEMVPAEVELGILAIAGAITAVMLPAMGNAALKAAEMVIALGPIATIGAVVAVTIGTLVYQLNKSTQELKGLHPVLEDVSMMMVSFGDNAQYAGDSLGFLRNATAGLKGAGSPEEYFAGTGYKSSAPPKPPGPALTGGGGGGGKDPVKEAERVSEAIEREWAKTTQTSLQQLEIWRQDQMTELEKVRAANENYERDKERVNATYSERRRKILLQEATDAINTFKTIRDGYQSIQRDITLGALTGSAKDTANIRAGYVDKIKSAQDYFDKLTLDYANATEEQKKIILAALDSQKVAYEISENGRLTFSKSMTDAENAYKKQALDEMLNYYRTTKDVQAEIDAAYQTGSAERLVAALTEENAIRMNNWEAQKSMMETYQQVFLAAHSTTAQLMASMYKGAFDGLSTAISDVLMGTKTLGQAFADLGKAMLKIVADYVAKWLAGRLMMAIFGKSMLAGDTAANTLAAAKTAAAWSSAAAMVSLATFGANSIPAMAGIAATVAMSAGMSMVPGLATGGITTGPTLAMVGEGRYQEAVLPLNRKLFEKMGLAQPKEAETSAPIYLVINGGVNDAAGIRKLIMDEGEAIVRSVTRQAKGFNIPGVAL